MAASFFMLPLSSLWRATKGLSQAVIAGASQPFVPLLFNLGLLLTCVQCVRTVFSPVVHSHLFQMTHRPKLPLIFTRKQKNQVFISWFICLRGLESEPSGYQGRRGDQRMPGADWVPLMTCRSLEYSQKTYIFFCVCLFKDVWFKPQKSKLSTGASTVDSVDHSSPGYAILSNCW